MVSAATRVLYSTPIKARPPPTLADWIHLVAFNLIFGALLIYSHLYQLAALPLALVPHPWAQVAFEGLNEHAKETFASSLVFIVSQFAPTTIVLTTSSDDDDDGDCSIDLEKLVRRDEDGHVVGFNLAKQAVWISNHQVRTPRVWPLDRHESPDTHLEDSPEPDVLRLDLPVVPYELRQRLERPHHHPQGLTRVGSLGRTRASTLLLLKLSPILFRVTLTLAGSRPCNCSTFASSARTDRSPTRTSFRRRCGAGTATNRTSACCSPRERSTRVRRSRGAPRTPKKSAS